MKASIAARERDTKSYESKFAELKRSEAENDLQMLIYKQSEVLLANELDQLQAAFAETEEDLDRVLAENLLLSRTFDENGVSFGGAVQPATIAAETLARRGGAATANSEQLKQNLIKAKQELISAQRTVCVDVIALTR